jgi:site-specific DNA-methyltransferase (adenine-specific)
MTAVPRNQILVGDAAGRLAELPDASVDCVVTSPPYYSLRDYEVDGQIGHEASIHAWVSALLAVTAQLARVLKPRGTFWLNVADSYSRHRRDGAPPKAMLLGPERLLLALTEQGWIVRSKGVWHKPHPMPDPAPDRLTRSWEPLYLLVRSGHYFFDLDAIRQPHRSGRRRPQSLRGPEPRGPGRRIPRWAGPRAGDQSGLARYKALGLPGHPFGKNPGDVWTIPQNNPRGVHHATYPEALIERPILAGCPTHVCAACGRPWQRPRPPAGATTPPAPQAACTCNEPPIRGLVLDPFMGSGTTAIVTERLRRDWIGIELNPTFADVASRRITLARASRTRPTMP